MKNPKKLIVEMLRSRLAEADRRRVQALADHAAAVAGNQAWAKADPDDGVGWMSRNPYNIENRKNEMEAREREFNEWKAAYHYAVNQFIEPRQWGATVVDTAPVELRIPASTKEDAQLLAYALAGGFEQIYHNGGVLSQRGIDSAKKYTQVIEIPPSI